jgi:hypothetical protein
MVRRCVMAARGWRAGGRCQKDPTEVQNEAPTRPIRACPPPSRNPQRHKRREAREKGSICVCNHRGPPRQLGCWFGGEGLSQGCISNLFPPMHVVPRLFLLCLCLEGTRVRGGCVRKLSELEKMQSTGLTPHIVVVVVVVQLRVRGRGAASHTRLGSPPNVRPDRQPGSEGDAGDERRGKGMHVVDWMRRGWKGKRRRSMAWKDIVGNPSSWSGAESRSMPR